MNVFQNILDLIRVEEETGGVRKTLGFCRTPQEAQDLVTRNARSGSVYFSNPCQATNIKGEWHLLGTIIKL